MDELAKAAEAVVARHYHEHTERCYGPYETCGEHHRHDNTCGSRPLHCRKRPSDQTVNDLRAALGKRLTAQQKGLGER